MKHIGITTTVPVEVLYTAGFKPVDLNNLFITSENYKNYIETAERRGFPKSSCAWIKGLYGVCKDLDIETIVGIEEGDCSNTSVLNEILAAEKIKILPFRFPTSHKLDSVKREIDLFIETLNVKIKDVENTRDRLNNIRNLVKEVDELTYKEFKVSGFENHLIQVSCSDFNGDPEEYKRVILEKLKEFKSREPVIPKVKLGYIGVPPMTGDLYSFVENQDAGIIYNEVQREFAFPRFEAADTIYHQYYNYTYPYSSAFRLAEIRNQIKERKLDGIIHYTQAFCHKALEDILIKDGLDIPILHIEGDKINHLDERTKLRLEAFIDMLKDVCQ